MKTAFIDCMFGISGDMTLGALVANGLPLETLKAELDKLNVDGFELKEERIIDRGIAAVHVDVITEKQHEHRHLRHITDIIENSSLNDRVKKNAIAVFKRLAEAEATVHGTTPEKIHFHEVGALDAIVDVVGACIGFDYFGVERIVSTPIHTGTGTVNCAHGEMPVPVPAVVELTKDFPVKRTDRYGEMTTPTGAAILTTLATSFGNLDNFVAGSSGYGAGTRKNDDYPNVLRISIGSEASHLQFDHSVLIETNIDDMNPEIFGYLADKLMAAGAKDVYMSPLYMKKGRPGTLLSVLTGDALRDTMIDLIFRETTTLGVRISRVMRHMLTREAGQVATDYGPVAVKIAHIGDTVRIAPEYEDCARLAREKSVPLLAVYESARKGALI